MSDTTDRTVAIGAILAFLVIAALIVWCCVANPTSGKAGEPPKVTDQGSAK